MHTFCVTRVVCVTAAPITDFLQWVKDWALSELYKWALLITSRILGARLCLAHFVDEEPEAPFANIQALFFPPNSDSYLPSQGAGACLLLGWAGSLFFQLYFIEIILNIQHCVDWWCTEWWFDTRVYCAVITMIKFVNTSVTSCSYQFLWVLQWGHFNLPSSSSFQVYNTPVLNRAFAFTPVPRVGSADVILS